MLGSDIGILATFGLPPRRLPAADLPQAFRVLAVALVPAPWLGTCARTLCAGSFASAVGALWPNDRAFSYPGRCPREVLAPKGKPGGNVSTFSSGAIKITNETLTWQSTALLENETQN